MTDPISSELLPAWTAALPHVLRLLPEPRRRMFRGELQRFLAMRRMQPAVAEELVTPLRELLMQSLRSAGASPALHATRMHLRDGAALERLVGHVLAGWREADAAADSCGDVDPSGRSGDVFFGPRLGGPGRPGAGLARSGASPGWAKP